MNWENFAYLMIIILGALGTMVATKYRIVVKELKEVADEVLSIEGVEGIYQFLRNKIN